MKPNVLAVLLLALCPAVWPLAFAAGKVKACDLLTKKEVEEITGKKMGKAELIDKAKSHNYTLCRYYTPQGDYFLAVSLMWDARLSWSMFHESKPGVVTGIGDDARWKDPWLIVLVKEMLLEFYLPGEYGVRSRDGVKAMAIRLAKKALPRVGR